MSKQEAAIIFFVLVIIFSGTAFWAQYSKGVLGSKVAVTPSINLTPTDIGLAMPTSTQPMKQEDVTELKIIDVKVGTGVEVTQGDTVAMHYRGVLTDGSEFDSSYKRGKPFETAIGVGQVIKGWDEGVPGMKVGGKRKLIIPPDKGYGPQGVPGAIPPNATLIFDVELVDVTPAQVED